MRGRLTVESRDKLDRWIDTQYQEQERSEYLVQNGGD
jgi:hypothetical protein